MATTIAGSDGDAGKKNINVEQTNLKWKLVKLCVVCVLMSSVLGRLYFYSQLTH